MSEYDILIIGGGPAASAAAIHAVSQGLTVCLFEREVFPRQRPGETLHPGAMSLLEQLGVMDSFERQNFIQHNGIHTKWQSDAFEFKPYQVNDELNEQWYGYQAHRPIFDTLLLDRAKQVGATVKIPCKVEKLLFDETTKVVSGLCANGQNYSGNYIIDASGSWQYLARKLKIPINVYSKKLYATYGYFEGRLPNCDGIPRLEADSQGWNWVALVADNLYQWTRLSFNGEKPSLSALPDKLKKLSLMGKLKCSDVSWRMVKQPAGQGYFITGDASVIMDPASSHGLLRALMTGIKSADLIANVIYQTCDENVAIHEYTRWLQEWCFHDLQSLHKLYLDIGQCLWEENAAA